MATIKQNLIRRLKEIDVLYTIKPQDQHHLNSYNLFFLQIKFCRNLGVDDVLWRSIYNKYWRNAIGVLAPEDPKELTKFLNYLTEGGVHWASGHAMNHLFPWEKEGLYPFAFEIHAADLACTWSCSTRWSNDLTVEQFKSFFERFKEEMNKNADKLFKVH